MPSFSAALGALFLATCAVPALAAGPDPVRLLGADRSGVQFEVAAGAPDVATLETSAFQLVTLSGFGEGGIEGAPALPERIVWIGVPEGVDVRITALPEETRFLDGVLPVPRLAAPRTDPEREDLVPSYAEALERADAEAPAYRASRGDGALAEFAGWSAVRSQRVAAIRLRPVHFDAASRRLVVHARYQVRVDFVGVESRGEPPVDDEAFEPVYRDFLLNYETARAFRRATGGARRAERFGAQAAAQADPDFNIATQWVRVRVRAKGIQRLSAADLATAGVPVGGVASSAFRLFAREGLPLLEENTYCDTCGLREMAIRVDDGGDGNFGTSDQILFYGVGASSWSDDYTGPDTAAVWWIDHPYENENSYWLTWNATLATPALRWADRDVAPVLAGAVPAPHFAARLHFEESRVYEPNLFEPNFFWDQWIWQTVTQGLGAVALRGDAPGAVVSEPGRLFTRFWGISVEASPRSIPDHFLRLRFNDVDLQERTWNGRFRMDVDSTAIWMRESANLLRIEVPPMTDPLRPSRSDQQATLFWELHYRRRFRPLGDLLDFRSFEGVGPGTPSEVALAPVTTTGLPTFTMLDVTDPLQPTRLVSYSVRDTAGGKALYWHESLQGPRVYFAAAANRFFRPALTPVTIRDIRSPAMSADYVVITYDPFEAQAQDLANHRAMLLPGISSPSAVAIRISDVYAWYSGGRLDPTAIRNFLYDITVNARWSPAPSYVCLLGDASYDFRNHFGFAPSGTSPALVPTYVHGFQSKQYLSDDWLGDLDLGFNDPPPTDTSIGGDWQDIPDFFMGRLPASTTADATTMIEGKILPYDLGKQFGEWRNRVLLVADDQFQTGRVDPLWGTHMYQTEALETEHIPPVEDRSKVYLKQYPSEAGANKVGANRDIVRILNEGVLIWNYFGHGNPFQMSDESAFRVGDVPSLLNLDRLPLCVAASCDLGKFDDPTKIGLAEALIKSPFGGAIATLAATEIAFATPNFILCTAFFDQVFAREAQGFPLSLGQALLGAKLRSVPSTNDRKYMLQGDPATRLAHPRYGVRMSIFDDENGAALADTLPRGRRVRVEGEVHRTRDESVNDLVSDYDGTLDLWVTDSAPTDTFSVFRGTSPQTYYYDPSTIYRGEISVEGGRFTARFYVPMEARLGPASRVRGYVLNRSEDGVGFRPQTVAPGSPSVVDTVGPNVDLRFTSGTKYVAPDAELRVVLADEHGINLTGNSPANAILLTIDDELRFDITPSFRYDANSHQQGSVLFRLPNLENGNHRVRVTATDNFAQGIQGLENRGEGEIEFTVTQGAGELNLGLLPFPNPFSPEEGTEILVQGIGETSDIFVQVFTLAGRRVRDLTAQSGAGSAQIRWDGRDASGAPVANGVYLLRVEVRPHSGAAPMVVEGRAAAFR